MLPHYLLNLIAIGETTGRPGSSLDQFVHTLEDEALTLAKQELLPRKRDGDGSLGAGSGSGDRFRMTKSKRSRA